MERKIQIANKIKQARIALGLSQRELGKLYGSSDVTIGEIERGVSNVSIPDLERLSGILGKPLSYFLSGQTEAQRPVEALLAEFENAVEVCIKAYIPVVDDISAGGGMLPVDYIATTRTRPAPENVIALRIKGLCLEPDIKQGDTVIIEKGRTPTNNDYVVVLTDGKVSVKRFKEQHGKVWLENNFGSYMPEDVVIFGVVIDLNRPMV